jgi:hypothetical protein
VCGGLTGTQLVKYGESSPPSLIISSAFLLSLLLIADNNDNDTGTSTSYSVINHASTTTPTSHVSSLL